MRIVSDKKDYYDSAMGQGVDLTKVFVRKEEKFLNQFPIPEWQDTKSYHWDDNLKYPRFSHSTYRYGVGSEETCLNYVYVLVAGKLYGGLKYTDKHVFSNPTVTWIWDVKELDRLKDIHGFFETKERGLSTYRSKYYSKRTAYQECKDLLSIKGDDVLYNWAVDNKISIAVCGGSIVDVGTLIHTKNAMPDKPVLVTIVNPVLKDYNFQKVLDNYTLYQELEMFIGGVLTNTEVIPELEDKHKVAAHGFDAWSFRKHKLDNK